MALIARIHAAGQSTSRVVRLRKGRNRLELQPGEQVEIVDEKTGKAPDTAHAERAGDDLVVTADATTIRVEGFYAASAGEVALSLPGTGYVDVTPMTSLAACAAGEGAAAAGAGGGMSTTAMAVLGAIAAGVGVGAVASGGKSGGGGQTPNSVPPATPTELDLAAADDTGASSSDNITRQTGALTITGKADAGSTVQILSGSTVLGSGTATAAGTFSIDITLPAGTTTITARASNSGGSSGTSTGLAITVDTTAPSAVTVGQVSGGAINAGEQGAGVTVSMSGLESGSARTVTLTGPDAANPGQTLSINATLDASGNLALTPTTLARFADGSFTISVQQTDIAGNVSTVSTTNVLLDRTAPTLTITSSTGALEFGQTATLTFTFSETPTSFTASDVSVTGGTISNLAATADPKVFTATLTPTLGAAGALVVAVANSVFTDAAGNAGTGATAGNIAYDPGTSGSGVDGYIAFALVFRDTNNNGVWDREAFTDNNNNGRRDAGEAFVDTDNDGVWDAERFTTTDANGDFANLGGFGRIVLAPLVAGNGDILTRDISTGAVFTKQFSAPDGSTVVSPLTTLVEAIAGSNATPAAVAAAEAQVKAVLGIDDGVDLRTFDPLAAATAADADAVTQALAVEVQKVAVQVANILNVVSTAAAAAEAYDSAAGAAQVAAAALAAQIVAAAGNGEALNLGNTSVVASVVGTVAAASTDAAAAAKLTGQAESVSTALATVNEAVGAVDATANVGAALAQVVATQIVAQVDLSTAVSTAITEGGVVVADNYSGTALADKVDSAAAQVEVIVPVTTPQLLGAPDRPTVDDGTRITAGELANGINVSVSYDSASGARAGDRLRLMLGGVEVGSVTLTEADIPASGQTRTLSFAVAPGAIGTDGSKVLTASFVAANAAAGPESLPVLLTVDTVALAPTIAAVSGGTVNAAEAAAGVPISLGGVEIGATASVKLVGVNLLDDQPLELEIPRVNNELRLTPQLLGQFKDGTLTVKASQTDAVGNVSAETTRTFVLDRAAPTAIDIGEISGRFISGAEAQAGVALTLANVEGGANVVVTVSGPGAGGGIVTQTLTGTGGSFTLSPTLLAQFGDGSLNVTAVQTDAAGNSSPVATQTVTLSRGAALLPPGIGDVSGGVINAAEKAAGVSFTLSGVDTAGGATVTVKLIGSGPNGAVEQELTAETDGSYRLTSDILALLGEGSFTLSATQRDGAGNVSAADTRTVILDSVAPAAPAAFALRAADDTGASANDGRTNKAVFTVTGTGEAGARVDILDGQGAVIKSGVVASNGTFAVEVTRPAGSNSLSARLTDAAGNVGVAGSGIVVIVDTTPPTAPVVGTVAGDNRINAAEKAAGVVLSLSGIEANAATSFTVSGNDAAAPANPLSLNVPVVGGMPTLDAALLARFANGTLVIRATQTDLAGNKSVVGTTSVALDVTAPAAPTSLQLAAADDSGASNGDGVTATTSGLTITGTAEPGMSIQLFDGANAIGPVVTVGSNGQFAVDLTLAEASYSITAVATDAAGNVSPPSAVLDLVIDATAPTTPTGLDLATADDSGASTTDDLTNRTTGLTITGTTGPGARVELFSGTTSLGSGNAGTDGTFSIDVSLPSGTSTVTATSTDLAGNVSTSPVGLTITVDASAPAAPAGLDLIDAADTGNPTDNLTALFEGLTINGTAEAGARVELFNGSTSLGTVTADGSGNFSFTNVTLQTGGNSLTARATDAAGNVSAASGPLNVTVDPTLLETRTGTAGDDDLAIAPGVGTLDGMGGNDTLTGADRNDVLIGGAGNDVIAGNAGLDTAVFAGNFADYSLSALTKSGTSFTVTDAMAGRDGIDTLSGIERLRFADKTAFIVGNGGYESIQAAINAASAGDVVFVAAGTWDERLVIDKPITLLGAKAGELAHTGEMVRGGAEYVGETVIAPSGPGAAITLAVNGPNALQNVTIDGFTFDKDESGLTSGQIASDVVIEFATTTLSNDPAQNRMANVVIKNNVFADVSMDAISGVGQHRQDLTITGNAFLSATNGLPVDGALAGAIVLENASGPADASNIGLSITGNLIRGFYFGAFLGNVQADGAQRATISDNVARDVVRLFSFDYDASGIDLHDNSFVNSPAFNATVDDGGFSYGSLSAFARFFYVGIAEPEFRNIRDIDIDGTSLSNIGYLVINAPVQVPASTAYGVDNLVIDGDEVDSTPDDAVGRVAIGGDLGIAMGGGAGFDYVFGAGGNDTLNGGGGNDNLEGGDGDDVLNGGDGDDEMNGDAGDDEMNGGAGDDDLEGKDGDDTIDGGDGFDNVVFLIPNELYTSLRVVQGTGADAGSVFVENVNGSSVTQLFRVSPAAGGGAEVTGLGNLAALGTDTVTNVERLDFIVQGQPPLSLFLSQTLLPITNGVGTALGTVLGDTLDLRTLYPEANATTTLNANGSFGNDTLTGHDGVNTLNGGAGNDNLSGLGGNDFLDGSAGDDTLNGGAGFDIGRFFLAPPLAGNFRVVEGTDAEAGLLFVERVDGNMVERLFRITPSAAGEATVTGLGAAAFLGTDTVTSVEQLSFQVTNNPFNANQFVRVLLDVMAPGIVSNMALVNGSIYGDTIDITQLYPLMPGYGMLRLDAFGDRGDDTIVGHVGVNSFSGGLGNDSLSGAGGDDYLQGNEGNDTIDGGEGNDTIAFNLPAELPGTFRVVEGTGAELVKLLVQRVDGEMIETVFRIEVTGSGAATIEGVGSAASFGTDTVTNAEYLDFAVTPFNPARFARINLTVQAPAVDGNGNAFVNGSAGADNINLDTFYPNNLNGNFGVEGGSGNDTIIGNAGNNGLGGGTGDDTIDGGAGIDNANFGLSNLVGTLEIIDGIGIDAGRYFVQRKDGETIEQLFRIELTGSGSATVTGLNSAALFGTDTVTNVEFLNFFRQGSSTGGVGLQIGVGTGIVDGVDFAFGSVQGDTINIPLLYANATAATPVNANGNGGDDAFIGHAGANKFFGDDGNDTMTGAGGNDELHGGSGTDVAVFSGNRADYTVARTPDGFITVIDNRSGSPDGTDRVDGFDIETLRFADTDVPTTSIGLAVTGGEAGEQLNGSNGPDVIVGNGGNDNLNGQDGDDTLTGGAGDDFVSGGGGNDVAVYSGNRADYTIETLAGGAVRVIDNRAGSPDGVDYVSNTTDQLQFTDQVFVLPGTPGQQINANSNNGATLSGGDGDDQISGGFGNDVLSGNAGDDSLFGSDGNDELFGNAGNDDLNGWLGDDVLLGGLGDDLLIGEAGDDELIGNIGNDVIIGGDGADYARGEEGADFIEGGEGNDILLGGYFGDHVAQPGDAGDTIRGFAGNDVLRGGDGDDLLEGGEGDDNLRGDLGNDTLDGGGGIDFVSIRFDAVGEFGRTYDHGSGIIFDASMVGSAGTVTLNDQRGGTDTLISIEAIGITGTNYGDTLTGGLSAAFSQLTGYGGNDTLIGGVSMEDIATYTGNFFDYSVVREANGTIIVTDLRNGSPDGTDTLSNIERLAFNNGGATYRMNIGTDGDDGFIGGTPGQDILIGNAGNDYLRGDDGNDLVNGDAGRDTAAFGLPVGTTGTLQLIDGAGADAGKLLVQRVDGQSVETLFRVTVNGVGAATVEAMGSAAFLGTDLVTNVEQLDFFVDNPNGPPTQYVGINLTPFFGQLQNNAAFVTGGEAGDQIDLAAFYGNVTAAQLDANGNRGNDAILGHDGRNFLQGAAGDDTLSGLAGDDGLNGGVGNDTLLGGADSDYMQGETGNDTIDGGTGSNDVAAFTLPNGTPGTLRTVEVSGADAGKLIVQRVDGNIVEDMFRVTVGNEGQATVEGLGARAGFGTDTVTNVDELHFVVSNDPFNPDQFTSIRLTPRLNPVSNGSAFVDGSSASDSIDLQALYPAADATIQLNANGNRGDDVITGHAGINNLQGNAGNDTLNGAGGNDRLEGQLGNDIIDGGAGTDIVPFVLPVGMTGPLSIRDGETPGTYVVQRTPANQPVEDLFLITMTGATSATVQGLNSAAFLGTDTVSNVERLEFFAPNGGPFTALNFGPTAFPANGANPAFVAGSVNADTIDVATFFPAADAATVINGNGDRGNDSITGHAGSNTLSGAQGDDQIFGLGGNDTLLGNIGADTLEGGEGDDVLIGGNNTGPSSQPGDLGDTLRGGVGNDLIRGGDGDDTLEGGDDDDNLRGDNGSDTMDGGAGRDFVSYRFDDLSTGVTFDATQFAATASFSFDDGRGGTDQVSNVESLGVTGSQGDDVIHGSLFTTGAAGIGYANQLAGEDGNDQLFGGDSNDQLAGDDGNDQLAGGDGDDDLIGGSGDDVIDGGSGTDKASFSFVESAAGVTFDASNFGAGPITVADGEGGTDTLTSIEAVNLTGSAFADTFTGTGSNDQFEGTGGNDTIDGGDGADEAFFEGELDDYDIVRLANGSIRVTDLRGADSNGVDVVTNVEILTFYEEDDEDDPTRIDLTQPNVAIGTLGDDTLTGTATSDGLFGGDGNDTLRGGDGDDYLAGGAGDDRFDDITNGRAGGLGDDEILGGAGNDFLLDFHGDNEIEGGDGNDTLGGTGEIDGGAGNDLVLYISSGTSSDIIFGGAGNDIFQLYPGIEANWIADRIIGFEVGNPAEFIWVAPVVDQLEGYAAGANLFAGGFLRYVQQGADAVLQLDTDAAGGNASFRDLVILQNVTLAQPTLNALIARTNLLVNGPNLSGNRDANTITGTAGNDVIRAFGGDDTVNAGDGNDAVDGGTGHDVINGGIGDDTLNGELAFELQFGDDIIRGDAGNDTLNGGGGHDDLRGGADSDTIDGGDGDDLIAGGFNTSFGTQPGDAADILRGGNGADVIRGGDGDDVLEGGNDNDNLRGDAGSDILDGGAGDDFVSYFFSAATSSVNFDASLFVPGEEFTIVDPLGGADTLRNVERLGIGGSEFDDVIRGSLAAVAGGGGYANQLAGNGGNDQLFGGNSDDRLEGGLGDDMLDGGSGFDQAGYNFEASAMAVTLDVSTIDAAATVVMADGAGGTDTLIAIEAADIVGSDFNDSFTGSNSSDRIFGIFGNDVIVGGGGDDELFGSDGADILTGGAGVDSFGLDDSAGATLSLADVITDFEVGTDKLMLEDGLTFEQLTITAQGDDSVIQTAAGDYLAVVQGVAPLELTSASFVMASGG